MPPIYENLERNSQIEELNDIKTRLARHNVSCSVPTIETALVTPMDLPQEMLDAKNLPLPGGRLLVNPFAKAKKAKGKKKKKKGKRGESVNKLYTCNNA